jgi:hypothetical protein
MGQKSSVMKHESEIRRLSWLLPLRVLSCIHGSHYKTMASEDVEGLVFAVVICRLYKSVSVIAICS